MSTNPKRPPKTREELALGVYNPKTNKRDGGFIVSQRNMKQNVEAVAAGDKSEDDLIEAAFRQADAYIARRDNPEGSGVDPFTEADEEYRSAQEERYRGEYDWNSSNDEASLQQLLDLEVQSRATNREFARAHLPVKDRTALLGELRNIAKDHAALQQKLGIDRPTRDTRRRSEDPMEAHRKQVEAGAARMRELIAEWAEIAPTAKTIDELRALAKHHVGLPYAWIDATLGALERLRGTSVPADSTAVEVE